MSRADDYPDLYLRAVSGGAALPRSGGGLSPDIVPWGTAALPSPQTLAEPPLWDQDPGQPLLPGVSNALYLRCANGSSSELRGVLHLAAGTPLLPCWPDQLTEVASSGGNGGVPIKVSGGKAAAIGTPFAFTPSSSADTLAAWVETVQHAPDPSVPRRSVHALQKFFADFPGYVQRSVAFGLKDSYTYQARYEQRDAAAEMKLEIRVSGGRTEWTVAVVADAADFPLQIAPMPLVDPDTIISKVATVPAGCKDTLTFRLDTHGFPPADGARIDLLLSLQQQVGTGATASQTTSFRLACHSWRASSPAADAVVRGSHHHRSQP